LTKCFLFGNRKENYPITGSTREHTDKKGLATVSLIDSIKAILGFTPQTTGELNRQATHRVPVVQRIVQAIDPLAGIEVTEEYRRAKQLIDANVPLIFLTGKAGTGKSTFIHYLRHSVAKRAVVLAPTGVAALNVQGATIHSFFRFPRCALSREDIQKVEDRKLYSNLDVLILDEVSMIRADVLDAIDTFLRLNGKDSGSPFGGTQVVMVGDLLQLPPVVATKEEATLFSRRYSSPFFFSAKALDDQIIAPVELERVFRQQDPAFVAILNRIRLGESSDDLLATINARLTAPPPAEMPIVLTPTNARADSINIDEMNALTGDVREYDGIVTGRLNLEEDKLPSPLHLRLKQNARVMFTKNDKERRWINGSLGVVTETKPDSITVRLEDMCRGVVTVEPVSWETYKYVYDEEHDKIVPRVVASYTQFPLMPAWAVTIHKSQGKTLPTVRVDLGNGAFAPGQTYVALSRARRLEDVWLGRAIKREDVFCDQRIRTFYAKMFNRSIDHGLPPPTPSPAVLVNPIVLAAVEAPLGTANVTPPMSQLALTTRGMIEAAMESGDSIEISYTDFNGNTTTRCIRPRVWVDGDRFTAFCDMRQAERDFRVSRISSCRGVE
jgi:ATP-dependent DNA helicase PIF1